MTDELSKYTGHDPSPEGIAARDAKDVTVLSYGDPADGMIVKDICEVSVAAYPCPLAPLSCTIKGPASFLIYKEEDG